MSQFLDYNESRGTWYTTDYNAHEDVLYINTHQDVDPVLERMKWERNSGIGDANVKGNFWHYASIPAWVEIEIKQKYGFSIHDRNATKDLLRVINRDYPWLKTTNLTHEIK